MHPFLCFKERKSIDQSVYFVGRNQSMDLVVSIYVDIPFNVITDSLFSVFLLPVWDICYGTWVDVKNIR